MHICYVGISSLVACEAPSDMQYLLVQFSHVAVCWSMAQLGERWGLHGDLSRSPRVRSAYAVYHISFPNLLAMSVHDLHSIRRYWGTW